MGLVGTLWGGVWNLKVEKQKQQGELIVQAIKTGDTKTAAANLMLLSEASLIELSASQVERLRKEAGPSALPVLPAADREVRQRVGTMELAVAKSGGPVRVRALVGSTGDDDVAIEDGGLTPGPATIALLAGNSYSIVWSGSFIADGEVTLKVTVHRGAQDVKSPKAVRVAGRGGETFFRVVQLP